MQLGPHFTTRGWATILGLYGIKPPTKPSPKTSRNDPTFKKTMRKYRRDMQKFHKKDLEFRKKIINVIKVSLYQHFEQSRNVRLFPLGGKIIVQYHHKKE